MPTWVKICGITSLADAERAVALGANALGFVFHRPSPRYVAPPEAREIVRQMQPGIMTVGVWLDETIEQIVSDVEMADVLCIQTYDAEAAAKLIKGGRAVIFATDPSLPDFTNQIAQAGATSVILDFGRQTGDIGAAIQCPKFKFQNLKQIILAGGLTPENVVARLITVGANGVDVASGVESSPGRKDHEKLKRFFEGVRKWDATAGSAGSADDLSPKP